MQYQYDIKGKEKLRQARKWVSDHKVEIFIGVALTIVAGFSVKCILESKSKTAPAIFTKSDTLPKATEPLKSDIILTSQSCLRFKRSEHIRKLHDNQRASIAKLIEAAEKGIELERGETLVKECVVEKKLA